MNELICGKIKTKDLATWFNISYSTFRKKAQDYLKELESFCEYKKYHGGVEVIEIYIPYYKKNLATELADAYLKEIKNTKNNLSTIAGMARKLIKENPDTWGRYSNSGLEKKLRKVAEAMFGKTNLPLYRKDQTERYSGPYGYREYQWAIKIDNLNKYRTLTEEEIEKFHILLDSYHITKEEVAIKEQYDKQKLAEFKNNLITKEEYILAMEHSELFPNLLSRFKEVTGQTLVRATYHDIMMSEF